MKTKLQKREEAAARIKKEIDRIEKLPEDQICDYRLRSLKNQYNKLVNYKTTDRRTKEENIKKQILNEYSIEDYLDDIEAYEREE